jgi:V/A-type H+-transporting ATPase subunit I
MMQGARRAHIRWPIFNRRATPQDGMHRFPNADVLPGRGTKMFWATPMLPVRVLCLDRALRSVMTMLGDLRVVHLVAGGPDGFKQLVARDDPRLAELEHHIQQLLPEAARAAPVASSRLLHEAFQPLDEAADTLRSLERAIAPLREAERHMREDLENVSRTVDFLEPLEPAGLSLDALRDARFVALFVGSLPEDGLGQLRTALHGLPHALASAPGVEGHLRAWVTVNREHEARVRAVLESLYFSPWPIPEGDTLGSLLDGVEESAWQLREGIAGVQSQIRQKLDQHRPILLQIGEAIAARRMMMESLSCIARSERTCLVSGWVPRDRHEEVAEAIGRFPKREALMLEGIAEDVPPTEFRRPAWLEPFSALTEGYGHPLPHEIDPTPFVALSFVGLFGIMFADVGHGLLLLIVAILLRVLGSGAARRYAALVGAAGLSATAFGALFGSMFGLEGVIQPLWFHPFSNVERLLMLALGVGIGLLSLGFVLSTVQALRRGMLRDGLLGPHGLVGLVFYWSVAGMAVLALSDIRPPLPWSVLVAWVGSLLLVAAVAPTLGRGEEAALEASAGLLELVIGLLANTLSFLRVAAFHLSHAGLCLAVYSLGRELGRVVSSGGFSVSVIVEGQILIIALEGLVVSIQCLRLNYYEFFSRFFRGGGTHYRPFGTALADGRSTA